MNDALFSATGLQLAYERRVVCDRLDLQLPRGAITTLIGPNGCGKSTLLRALCRLITPRQGEIRFDGRPLATYGRRELARRLGFLPQVSSAPPGIRVHELVARGRFPYQGLLRQWSDEDEAAVAQALRETGLAGSAHRLVDQLSGGQRQRVWIALVLAQDTEVLVLDEPTTYLDLAHQLEVLALCRRLNAELGKTLVLVLHDLNLAARHAHHLVAMKDGRVVATGTPAALLTPQRLEEVFGIRAQVLSDPVSGTPLVVPMSALPAEAATACAGRA
ncbi:ABC transporter ATP-binding protein [Aquabacterium sp. OR-4]|uniref:ABC transporter ATP-binding protein n=1 Tax=Aquabacterium sp. OR-4 TaxID=2978127 RepID=UPI0028C7F13B|nr:ABC transporter ATP-binding protein [Aquabacterium sp. OR-4]MDT7839056.1 ABC transporter ATP-binding protein [Aquabacterium sp. OR-4]